MCDRQEIILLCPVLDIRCEIEKLSIVHELLLCIVSYLDDIKFLIAIEHHGKSVVSLLVWRADQLNLDIRIEGLILCDKILENLCSSRACHCLKECELYLSR